MVPIGIAAVVVAAVLAGAGASAVLDEDPTTTRPASV